MPCLPSWLSVLPMVCVHLCSCLPERSRVCHGGTVVPQSAGWDRPVKEERQDLMSGPQQEELSSGLQQHDAIWPRSRQLPEINAIPSVPHRFFSNNSLSSFLLDGPLPFLFLYSLSCPAHPVYHLVFTWCVSSVPLPLCFFLSLAVWISLLPPAFLSLSSSCPVSQWMHKSTLCDYGMSVWGGQASASVSPVVWKYAQNV